MTTTSARLLLRYGFAIVAITLATSSRLVLGPFLGDRIPFPPLLLAILIVAVYAGRGPAVLSAVIGAIASAMFLLPRREGYLVDGIANQVGLTLFLVVGVGIALLGGALSEKKKAAAEVEAARDHARTILESITDAFFALDRDWRFSYVNRQAEAILGRSRDDLVGKSLWREYPGTLGGDFERNYRRAVDEGVVVTFEAFYPPHDRWYEARAYPSPDGLSVYFRDVTGRKRAEEERARLVAASEQRRRIYETALSNSPDFNYIFDLDGRFTYINARLLALWQKGFDEAVGRDFFDLGYPRDLAERLQAQIRQVIETREPVRDETPYTSHLGERRYEYIFVPVLGEGGAVEAVVGSTRDITERKRAEDRLRLFVEHAPAAVAMLDREMRYLLVSRRWLADFELGEADLEGRDHYEAFPNLPERWREVHRRALAGEVIRTEEEPYVRPDGREEWLRREVRPWRDDRGEIGGVIIFSEIITERRRARRVIQEHAETLSGILGASVDHIWVIDREGRYRQVSTGGARVLGHEPAELIGKHWRDLGLADDVMAPFDAQRERVLRSGQPERQEVAFVAAGGEAREYEYTIAPVDRTGSVVVVSRDVTRQKVAERERLELLRTLETRNAFINAVLAQVPAAIMVADAATGRLLMSNDEARRIVRHEYEPGRKLDDDYESTFVLEATRPDGRPYRPGEWPLERALAGEAVEAEEMEIIRGDHSRATIRVNAGPIRVGEEVVAAVVAFHDITDRKAAEQTSRFLAEASASLSAVVDLESTLQKVASLAVPTFADWAVVDMVQPDGSTRRLAVAHSDPSKVELAAELHRRYPPDPESGRGLMHVLRTGRSEIVGEITDAMLVAGARDEEYLQIIRELGLTSFMCVPLAVRGEILGAISFVSAESGRRYDEHDLAVAEDLASRAAIAVENGRLYGELKEADQMKNQFLATLAHELRNPLAPIRNVLRLMGEPSIDASANEADRAMAERQVVHLTRLIDDLMDIARVSRGKIELHKEVVDLATIVHQAVETSRDKIDERYHRLEVSLPDRPIRLDADPTRLEQVLWNLLNNAAKYSPPGSRIDLVVEPGGAEVAIRVRDTGIGIEREMLPRVFDMFIQVDGHKEHAGGGLGIGLCLVRTLVELHGGSIVARSDGPGLGSEFELRLPILASAPGRGARPSTPIGPNDGDLARRRILVVDDNEDAAESLARLLKRLLGQDVRVALDGPSALEEAEAFRPEVVLLDIGLPGMDGYGVAREIRNRPWGEEMVIVALTGWGQDEDRRRSLEAGFDHHLVKPVAPEDLRTLLTGPGSAAPG